MKKPKKLLPIILITFILIACGTKQKAKPENSQSSEIDSSIIAVDSVTILNKHFLAIYRSPDSLFLLRDGDTILSDIWYNNGFEFIDFDSDGYKDLIIERVSNVGGIKDLLLFDTIDLTFKLVEDLSEFPSPEKLAQDIYYSYAKAGCADAYWISLLFEIKNFKTVPLGEIYGQGCEEGKKRIDIYKIRMNETQKKIPVETLPLDTIEKFQNTKWGFIKYYWTNKYKDFLK
jgi:hypothetical protein